jgi:hypothetical protein
MNFLERYKNGETIQVYADIHALGQAAFTERYFDDVQAVMRETMTRTAHNLDVIYSELKNTGYNFKRKPEYSFEKPLLQPLSKAGKLITKLEKAVAPFGAVPLSLKLFYEIVGSCNFAWDYETNDDIPWPCADPIQIISLDDLVEQVTDEYWPEEMEENQEDYGAAYLEVSADYYHKDNISGGPAYSIEITREPGIDSRLLNEEHETTFINYLRTIFENGGFGRIDALKNIPGFRTFLDNVQPKLKAI